MVVLESVIYMVRIHPYDFILILHPLSSLVILLSAQYLFFHCVTLLSIYFFIIARTYCIPFSIVCVVSSLVFGHQKIMEIIPPLPFYCFRRQCSKIRYHLYVVNSPECTLISSSGFKAKIKSAKKK